MTPQQNTSLSGELFYCHKSYAQECDSVCVCERENGHQSLLLCFDLGRGSEAGNFCIEIYAAGQMGRARDQHWACGLTTNS